jgi:putative ATP-binding cassette transporter
MAAVSGIANAALLGVINAASHASDGKSTDFKFLFLFIVAMTTFVVGQKYMFKHSTIIVEEILNNIRRRLSDLIRKTSLLHLDTIGQSAIYNRLTQETNTVSTSAGIIIASLQSAVMLFFVAFYIMLISKIAFFLILFLLLVAILYYLANQKKLRAELNETNIAEMQFFESLTDILSGIKEIKMNNQRSDGLYAFLSRISGSVKKHKISTGIQYFNNFIFSQSFYYFLIAVIVFLLPRIYPTYSESLTEITAAILFMIGPVGAIVGAIQSFDQVDYAIGNIYQLEETLNQALEQYESERPLPKPLKTMKFDKIKLDGLYFAYNDRITNDTFAVGPLDLEFKAGETVFVVGGNGSGKTTFLKVLAMLYYRHSGAIYVDDTLIDETNAVAYRQLFTAVYTEFHLFSRFYGMDHVTPEQVDELLKLMEIENKTQFLGNRFSTQDLSAGQRKRLALLMTFLEDKPIYILDEWAADQDPEFRKFFYEKLLTRLKDQGKTIIAASHDDRYFHFADRVIKMDYGKIVEDSRNDKTGNNKNNKNTSKASKQKRGSK